MLASDLGLHLIETNSSLARTKEDLALYLDLVQSEGFTPTLFFFDEADGVSDFVALKQIILTSTHPIVLACNELKEIPEYIQELCTLLKPDKPRLQEVIDIVKKAAPGSNLSAITPGHDIRSALLAAKYGGTQRTQPDTFRSIERLLKYQTLDPDLDLNNTLIWLTENLPNFYMGPALVDNYEILSLADYYQNPAFLKLLPKAVGSVVFPRFFLLHPNEHRTTKRRKRS